MTYREYLTSFVGKKGQFACKEGMCEITLYSDSINAFRPDDACQLTDSLDRSTFCETDPAFKSTKESYDCMITKVYDDFVLIECSIQKVLKAVPFDALILSVQGR